ncbi:MAG: rod shape-determining protein RodA [Thermodesulfobacteriota bacterium]
MFDRRLINYFNWKLLGITLLVGGFGLMVLYSSLKAGEPSPNQILFTKQIMWFSGGLVLMVAAFLFNYKHLDRWAYVVYALLILLLIGVLLFGKHVAGARRWLAVGPVSIQPSELAKIGVIIVLSHYYSKVADTRGLTFRELLLPMGLTLIPVALIIKQPDLGTAVLILLIASTVTLFMKVERRTLIGMISSGAALIPLTWFFLKGYQKQRILTFLDPDRDPLGAGYHIIQSKIAIGSGMAFGKGFQKGTQNILAFIPEQHTDFIFSVMAEEWGFVGAGAMIVLLMMIIIRSLQVAHGCREPFGTILGVGIAAMIFWQVVINVGMVMGLMPVVGVPLPLVSYGGSSVMTIMISMGILLNISMRRFMFEDGKRVLK